MVDALTSFLQLPPWYLWPALLALATVLAVLTRGWKAISVSRGAAASFAVNAVFAKGIGIIMVAFGAVLLGVEAAYDSLGLPAIPRNFWDVQPFWLTALCVLVVYDFSIYWIHRWLHTSVLWPTHAVHHSDEHLHFLTWARAHPAEQILMMSGLVISMTWMGLSVTEVAGIASIRIISQYYVHSNIDWDHGPLKYAIASPRFHRWHHVDHPDAYDKNFASMFPVFDLMFGTYYNPHSAADMPTGFESTPGNDIVKLLVYPFTEWAAMLHRQRHTKVTASDDLAGDTSGYRARPNLRPCSTTFYSDRSS